MTFYQIKTTIGRDLVCGVIFTWCISTE